MSATEKSESKAGGKQRVSMRLNPKFPEQRLALDVINAMRERFGTNAAGDLMCLWLVAGSRSWRRDGGLANIAGLLGIDADHHSNMSNTSSNDDGVLSINDSHADDTPTEIGVATPSAPARSAGFVGMLGMGLSEEGQQG